MSNSDESRLQDRFVRWQETQRQSLSSHITLIAAFSSAGLGFVGAIINGDDAKFAWLTSWVMIGAAACFLVSLFLALFISYNRLQDVRSTLEILKHRKKQSPGETINALKEKTDNLGKCTWKCIYCQLGFFSAGAALFIIGVFLAFQHKLFQ